MCKENFRALSLMRQGRLLVSIVIYLLALSASMVFAQTYGMVVDGGNANVIVFDADTDTVVGSVNVIDPPEPRNYLFDCAILDDQSLGIVSNFYERGLFLIDLSVPALADGINPIPVSMRPEDITISADQQFLLYTDGASLSGVQVVDIAARSLAGPPLQLYTAVESVEACSDNMVLATGSNSSLVYRLTIDDVGNLTDTGETDDFHRAFNVACGPTGGNAVVTSFAQPYIPGEDPKGTLQSYVYPPLSSKSSRTLLGTGGTVVISPDGSEVYHRTSYPGFVEGFTYDESTGALSADPFVSFAVADASGGFGVDLMAIHPNGSKLYVSEGASLNVYDSTSGVLLNTITHPDLEGGIGVCLPKSRVIEVDIDIKPDSDQNCFNIDGHGVIPVAILGSDTFDVTQLDSTTLMLNGLSVRVRGKGPLCSLEDSNGDSFLDMVCHFEDDSTMWVGGSDFATVTGTLLDGRSMEGSDSICIVP